MHPQLLKLLVIVCILLALPDRRGFLLPRRVLVIVIIEQPSFIRLVILSWRRLTTTTHSLHALITEHYIHTLSAFLTHHGLLAFLNI